MLRLTLFLLSLVALSYANPTEDPWEEEIDEYGDYEQAIVSNLGAVKPCEGLIQLKISSQNTKRLKDLFFKVLIIHL